MYQRWKYYRKSKAPNIMDQQWKKTRPIWYINGEKKIAAAAHGGDVNDICSSLSPLDGPLGSECYQKLFNIWEVLQISLVSLKQTKWSWMSNIFHWKALKADPTEVDGKALQPLWWILTTLKIFAWGSFEPLALCRGIKCKSTQPRCCCCDNTRPHGNCNVHGFPAAYSCIVGCRARSTECSCQL